MPDIFPVVGIRVLVWGPDSVMFRAYPPATAAQGTNYMQVFGIKSWSTGHLASHCVVSPTPNSLILISCSIINAALPIYISFLPSLADKAVRQENPDLQISYVKRGPYLPFVLSLKILEFDFLFSRLKNQLLMFLLLMLIKQGSLLRLPQKDVRGGRQRSTYSRDYSPE